METTKTVSTFHSLKIDEWLINQCKLLGIEKPTPVQANCIPPILEGRDCIGCDRTGSGKTFAFALPIVQTLSKDPYGIFALVLTPTRELAYQIADQFQIVGKSINLRLSVIVGGMGMMEQGIELSNRPHIVIATPGRLADHLESCQTFSFKSIKFLVMDEADRLLEGNFDEQLQTIFQALPEKRQTLLFSATITDTLTKLRECALNNPFMWSAPVDTATVEELDQRYILVPADFKDGYLVHVVQNFREEKPKGSIIIFTDTCRSCQILSMTLLELGFQSLCLHSMMSQRERIATLTKFRSNTVKILVATDVASRGLDIPTVQLIVNHNVPSSPKEYVHRVGRTARAGRGGLALTLITPNDIKLLHAIEGRISKQLLEYKIKEKEVIKIMTQVAVTKREQEINLDEQDFGEKKRINKRKKLIEKGLDPEEADREIEADIEWKRRRGDKNSKSRKGKGSRKRGSQAASSAANLTSDSD
ncbi:hypothetical protein GHT06_010552 [Daphnia sinensis]|uniref:RNA helicase n=1 Tax=Daphnia sinensis TaxID=1820382 RepID=A0AAD5LHZ2_9CRUS|nr:hypothetical protein GHT06_010552 [Daphnia sinensis]